MYSGQRSSGKRALIIKLGAIGDAVMALPLARELAASGFSEITWMGGSDIASLLTLVPEISTPFIINERALFGASKISAAAEVLRTWWRLKKLPIDDVYLLHADRRYKLLVPPWLRSKIHTVRVGSRRHHTFDYARLAYPLTQDHDLRFAPYTLPSTSARENRICIFPGGAKNAMRDNPLRRWPLENYVALCELLLDRGEKVSVVGGPSDGWIEPSFASIKSRLDWRVGTMKLNETVEFLRVSKLAISHDTGPVHLSSLADCPVVTIFGPTNSEWFGPLNFMNLVSELSPKLPCQPCYDGKEFGACTNNICVQKINPNDIMSKVTFALDTYR